MKQIIKNTLIFTASFFLIASLFTFYEDTASKPTKVGMETLIKQIDNEEIKEIIVRGSLVELELNSGEKEIIKKEIGESFSSLLDNYGVDKTKVSKIAIQVKDEEGFAFWFTALAPFLIPFLIIGFFLYMMLRGVQGANSRAMGFGQAQVKEFNKDAKNKIKFKDIAGVREAKEELAEVVDFLKNPDKFTNLGALIPKGVLLLGSPGTGKTLLARAVAGEANVAFFHISGSEFVEMFVGVGASRVRSLFKTAKKSTPCIIFIDEIDAVGRKRGSGMGGSHDEREQTLNQILVEMDGFDPRMNIIVMAATNRPDVLDPALLRPGRFDRQIVLDLPDIQAREAILKIHARRKPLARDVTLRRVAERTPGFSGADLANILNEAAILTARRDKKLITMNELFESIERVMMGPERRSRVITEREKQITAYHEAGHAIIAHYLPHTDPVQKITIIARGRAGGYTLKIPLEDKHMYTKQEFIEEIAVLLGGFLTEKEIYGEVTTGATSDLRRATQIARKLITDYGMCDTFGPRTFGDKEDSMYLGREIHEQRDYSEKVAEQIDKEINNFIMEASVIARKVIKKEKAKLKEVVDILLEKETIEKAQFENIVGKKAKLINNNNISHKQ
ncbi:ATP-dependent zinc metalloprotease FtsH [Patescibacteria group bacterium]|nr:ATP-dependent zinc metalloprotease FtsH [Patescibacteria group bacterium]